MLFKNPSPFRESCCKYENQMAPPITYVKDLNKIGRPLDQTIILDNSPLSYMFQRENGIPITTWMEDPSDTELLDLIKPLQVIAASENVYEGIKRIGGIQALPIHRNYVSAFSGYGVRAYGQAPNMYVQQGQSQGQQNSYGNYNNQQMYQNYEENDSQSREEDQNEVYAEEGVEVEAQVYSDDHRRESQTLVTGADRIKWYE